MLARALSIAVFAILFASPSLAAVTCSPPAGSVVALSRSSGSTSSMQFDVLPGSEVSFTTTGGPSCLQVRFSGDTVVSDGRGVAIRVVLDHGKTLLPKAVTLSAAEGDSAIAASVSRDFFAARVEDGDHTVRVKWRSLDGQPVDLNAWVITVTY